MPHSRQRYAAPLITSLLAHSPIVGMIGQRQTGKTTLASAASKEYATFDQQRTLEGAENDPEAFLSSRKHPFTIDECQLCPKVFPALKEHVWTRPRKGQFILTGSVGYCHSNIAR